MHLTGGLVSETGFMLRTEGIYKSFGATKALRGAKLELRRGQVLGLIGENGSGKSTLASIIAGMQSPDAGQMELDGRAYKPLSSMEANGQGVGMILQERGTFDTLTVANNIFVGEEELFVHSGTLNRKALKAAAKRMLEDVRAEHIDPAVLAGRLSFEDRKLVELARTIGRKPKVFIADETTTALSRNGRDILYAIIGEMKAAGNSVIFISHDLDEVMWVCDAITILRDGTYVDTLQKDQFDPALLRRLMVGRELAASYYRTDSESCKSSEVVLSMEHVSCRDLKDVSFELHKGEILGFGGLADCGMHTLGNVAFGLTEPDLGTVRAGNGRVISSSPVAVANRVAYISKNRDQETLLVSCSVKDNICLASYPQLRLGPVVLPSKERDFVRKWAEALHILMRNPEQCVLELSGGNKQKVALAKWLGSGADVFILDCPTRGIDVGVKANIYSLLLDLRGSGKSVIMISEELAELIGMCDRVIILKGGNISGVFSRGEDITEHKLIEYMV